MVYKVWDRAKRKLTTYTHYRESCSLLLVIGYVATSSGSWHKSQKLLHDAVYIKVPYTVQTLQIRPVSVCLALIVNKIHGILSKWNFHRKLVQITEMYTVPSPVCMFALEDSPWSSAGLQLAQLYSRTLPQRRQAACLHTFTETESF